MASANKRFIKYLDNIDKEVEKMDFFTLNGMIHNNMIHNNLINLDMLPINKSINVNSISLKSPTEQPKISNYDIWKFNNEVIVDLSMNPSDTSKIEKTKRIDIEVNIVSIQDLIDIVNKHPYEEDTDYNIDLKTLHNIKCELIELNDMIGMKRLKTTLLDQLLYFIQSLHKGNNIGDYKHTVIYGPPGTGKTEVAKIIGNMYSKIGILKKNIFKKVTRSDLVAGYLGQTAIKTKNVIQECVGGVLFIDEAYSLASPEHNDSFSKECIDTLCESLSDCKDDIMVIIAGYEKELEETFFRANKGLDSRFIWRFTIDSYNNIELRDIMLKKVKQQEWTIETAAINESWFSKKGKNFIHYGRDIEALLTHVKIAHGRRIYGKSKEQMKHINAEDLERGYTQFIENSKKQEDKSFLRDIYV
jgi:SpoVK/Ycf46/Vps4 family AAA+-type ATPase